MYTLLSLSLTVTPGMAVQFSAVPPASFLESSLAIAPRLLAWKASTTWPPWTCTALATSSMRSALCKQCFGKKLIVVKRWALVGLLSLPPWTVCLRSVQTLSVSFPKFLAWSPWLNNYYKSSYMYAYFKSSLNILISKKILSQYRHVRENTFSISSCQRLPFSPSSPPT